MNKVLLCFLLFICNNLFGQTKFGLEASLGGAIPTHSDLSKLYYVGLNGYVGFPINVLHRRLFIKPAVAVKWFLKEVDKVNSVTENTRIQKGGLEFQYVLLKDEPVQLWPFIRIDYNWLYNYSQAHHYDPATNVTSADSPDDYLTGQAFSFAFGTMIKVKDFHLKIDYEFFSPNLTMKQSLIDDALKQGYQIAPHDAFNFNTFNISVGYTLWIVK